MLGYTQFSWENFSGEEPQPASADKAWAALTDDEKAAARVLGYTGTIWDNESGAETQPASANKYWAELTSCGAFRSIALTLWLFLAAAYQRHHMCVCVCVCACSCDCQCQCRCFYPFESQRIETPVADVVD